MLKRDITNELAENFINYLNKLEIEKNNNDYDKSLAIIDSAFKDIFKLGIKFFNSLSNENLVDMTSTNGKASADKCIMMAKLFEEEARILEIQNKLDDSFYINQKSLNIFLDTYSAENDICTLKKYFSDIPNIINSVIEYKLPTSLQIKIRDYYAMENKFDKADNIAYEILEENNYDNQIVHETLNFYKKLLSQQDLLLTKGGITKSEIEESIRDLEIKL
ncbi:hypothetical protein KM800_02660 [Clostridium tyrobutyricum]|uniref:DUF6483 family protein n=1 Tax=Clostridium tyrobutyricum TaxID=1519 RepID=UPI001C394674|nr:DUF6483 family protein [Clostridium tyrobutyricum]MBV4418236.1 hypothetical protein [Clostridium tyrobutyricum]